jgi:hypothetical protein
LVLVIQLKLGVSDLASDYADLGATYNAFSLHESESQLQNGIEKVGQAIDSSFLATNAVVMSGADAVVLPILTAKKNS